MKGFPLFILLLLLQGCKVSAINYAQGDIRITSTTKVVVDNRPAVEVGLTNAAEIPRRNILVTVKAKRNQKDLDVAQTTIPIMEPGATVEVLLTFENLTGHAAYDFLTYAVTW